MGWKQCVINLLKKQLHWGALQQEIKLHLIKQLYGSLNMDLNMELNLAMTIWGKTPQNNKKIKIEIEL